MRPTSKLGKAVEWIDGATIHRSGEAEESAASGFAWALYDLDLKLLTKLIPIFSNEIPTTSRKYVKALKQSLGKLFLWGDGFRDGRLEKVLDESDDLEETLMSSLVGIGRLLISIIDTVRATITSLDEEFETLVEELRIFLEKARTLGQNGLSDGDTTDLKIHEDQDRLRISINSLTVYTTCLMDLLPSMEDMLSLAHQAKDEDWDSLP